jgi:hypothetical protein
MRGAVTRIVVSAALAAALTYPAVARADPARPVETGQKATGRPNVVLDRLELPAAPDAEVYKRHLRQVLRREARHAQWGVGRGHRIEFRFVVDELEVFQEGNVLRVRCSAIGRLPKGKSARSRLSYGGDPKKRQQVVFRVLEIVARGVVTRLAELERNRREQGELIRPREPVESD